MARSRNNDVTQGRRTTAAAVPSAPPERATVIAPELLRELRRLHFQTRRLADQGVTGRYRSAFRGTGVEFEEVREYVPGDDVRGIDWKVTARSRAPYVKIYREERELTVLVAVDVSASTLTGTRGSLRAPIIARAGAVLTLIALNNNDRVGLVTWSDSLESYHPPRKGRGAVWRVLHEVLTHPGTHKATDLGGLCSFLSSILRRRSIVFLVSDFIGPVVGKELALLTARHDVTAITVSDPADDDLPVSGLVSLVDPESGRTTLVDTSDPKVREQYRERAIERATARRQMIVRAGAGEVELRTDRPFMPDLRRYLESKALARSRVRMLHR